MPETEFKNYLLDADEFKRWCDTSIQILCKSFELNSSDKSKENKIDFFNTVLTINKCISNFKINNYENVRIYDKMFKNEIITSFIQTIYKDSQINKDKPTYRNNFKTFKKWFYNELMKVN